MDDSAIVNCFGSVMNRQLLQQQKNIMYIVYQLR